MIEGGLVEDRYRLLAPLGRGGMAEVWKAEDLRLRRAVAIKFLTSRYAGDPEFLVRFFSEAQAVAQISHINVVRVLDFGSYTEGPFLVMELVDGGSLADRDAPVMDPELARSLIADAAAGAGAAHERGVTHRDIKPGNILLGDGGTPKIADFGIALQGSKDDLAATGTAIGSPNYISPEGAQGGEITPASDVYSLGVVLYELLTGVRPFEASSPTALAIAHIEEEPVPPSARRRGLPTWVDPIVMKCLAKDPSARYPDGNALATALKTASTDVPLAADQVPQGTRRGRAVAIASVAAAAVIAIGGFMWATGGPEPEAPSPVGNEGVRHIGQARSTPTPTTPDLEVVSTEVTEDEPTPTPSGPVNSQASSPYRSPDTQVHQELGSGAEGGRSPNVQPSEDPVEPVPTETPSPEESPYEEEPPEQDPSPEPEPEPSPQP